MAMAAKTWTGNWWDHGGGGTAWDSIVYDPKLKLVYIGTGNGGPHAQHGRGNRTTAALSQCAPRAHRGSKSPAAPAQRSGAGGAISTLAPPGNLRLYSTRQIRGDYQAARSPQHLSRCTSR